VKILLILAWAVVGAAIIWWPRPSGFNARWVAMPQAMSWQTLNAARNRADYTFCKWPNCQRS
jgi:hypothetical protein